MKESHETGFSKESGNCHLDSIKVSLIAGSARRKLTGQDLNRDELSTDNREGN